MKPYNCEIELKSKSDCVLLRGLFDVHAGVKACDIELFKEHVEEVRTTPNMYAFLGGDMCECINPTDKRFDPKLLTTHNQKNLDNLVMNQANQIIDILRPIQHKLLFSLEGNHEDKFRLKFNMDVGNYIAMGLQIPMLGYSAMVRITFAVKYNMRNDSRRVKKNNLKCVRAIHLLATHGVGGIKLGTAINKMEDLIKSFEFDIIWGGHNHKLGSAQATRIYLTRQDTPRIFDKNKILILAGTYLKTYDDSGSGYGERKMYQPTPLGCVTLKIVPFPGAKSIDGNKVELSPQFEITNNIAASSGSFAGDLWDIEVKE